MHEATAQGFLRQYESSGLSMHYAGLFSGVALICNMTVKLRVHNIPAKTPHAKAEKMPVHCFPAAAAASSDDPQVPCSAL